MRRLLPIVALSFAFTFVGAVALPSGEARADEVAFYYYGQHPLPDAYGGGWCYDDSDHVHVFAPDYVDLYVYEHDHYVFVGDPVFFGYTGDVYWYYGPHPVYTPWGVVISYVDGPVRRWYVPPPTYAGWYYDAGYYYYRGTWPAYYRPHHRLHLRHYHPRRYSHYSRYAPAGRPPERGRTPAYRPGDRRPRGHAQHVAPRSRGGDRPSYKGSRRDRPTYGGAPAARKGRATTGMKRYNGAPASGVRYKRDAVPRGTRGTTRGAPTYRGDRRSPTSGRSTPAYRRGVKPSDTPSRVRRPDSRSRRVPDARPGYRGTPSRKPSVSTPRKGTPSTRSFRTPSRSPSTRSFRTPSSGGSSKRYKRRGSSGSGSRKGAPSRRGGVRRGGGRR